MKNFNLLRAACFSLIFLFARVALTAQVVTYIMQPGTFTLSCSVTNNLYDTGGAGGTVACPGISPANYGINQNITETFCTAGGQSITGNFASLGPNTFGIGVGDFFTIYDGPSAEGNILVGPLTATTATPAGFTSLSSCITIQFLSDNNAATTCKGWALQLGCGASGPPPNDNCATAFQLTPGAVCASISGTTQLATASSGVPSACTGTFANDDVWYSFVANNSSQTITLQSGSIMDGVFQLFSGTCASLVQIACINTTGVGGAESYNGAGFTVGSTYYIRVYDAPNNSNSQANAFTICVTGLSINDLAGAMQICGSSPVNITTSGKGNQEFSSSTFGCELSGEHRSAWLLANIATAGFLTFNTVAVGSAQDINYAVWGPFASQAECYTLTSAPLRCSYAANYAGPGVTGGLANSPPALSAAEFSETSNGDGYVYKIAALASQWYVILLDIFSGTSNQIQLQFPATNTVTFQCSSAFSCNLLQPICPGDSSLVSWQSSGTIFNAGNVFTAQLSEANGSFASPLNVGSVTSTATSGNIGIFAPANLTPGTHYRTRVVSSNPVLTATDNGIDIVVTAPVTYYQDADGDGFGSPLVSVSSCAGQPAGYVMNQLDCNDGNATINPAAPDICNSIDDNCNGIVDENAITATINPSGLIQICAGTVVHFTANTGAGINYQWVKNISNIAGATNSTYHTHKKGKYHVNETNSFGCTSSSPIGNIKIVCRQENTLPDEVADEPAISLFPNPTDGNLTVVLPDSNEPVTLIIFNELAQVVLTKQIPAHTTSLSVSLDAKCQSGIYLAKVISETETDAVQFVLMR